MKRQLHAVGTWQRTPRLLSLVEGVRQPTLRDIEELFRTFRDGMVGEIGEFTLMDFAHWIEGGHPDFGTDDDRAMPCEVVW